ncbi:MAG: DivIVA domain-containing protein, partial [Actinomycetota bacterium]|nr:DivIVA domain-containing protein [Actinomycetota bacterium]
MTSQRVPSSGGRDLLSADLIGERSFAVVRRGFDRDEVQEFLKQVAGAIRTLHQRIEQADEARREAEQRALHPEINEDVLMERVGEETANILRSARAAAGDMRTRAAEEATRIV